MNRGARGEIELFLSGMLWRLQRLTEIYTFEGFPALPLPGLRFSLQRWATPQKSPENETYRLPPSTIYLLSYQTGERTISLQN